MWEDFHACCSDTRRTRVLHLKIAHLWTTFPAICQIMHQQQSPLSLPKPRCKEPIFRWAIFSSVHSPCKGRIANSGSLGNFWWLMTEGCVMNGHETKYSCCEFSHLQSRNTGQHCSVKSIFASFIFVCFLSSYICNLWNVQLLGKTANLKGSVTSTSRRKESLFICRLCSLLLVVVVSRALLWWFLRTTNKSWACVSLSNDMKLEATPKVRMSCK